MVKKTKSRTSRTKQSKQIKQNKLATKSIHYHQVWHVQDAKKETAVSQNNTFYTFYSPEM